MSCVHNTSLQKTQMSYLFKHVYLKISAIQHTYLFNGIIKLHRSEDVSQLHRMKYQTLNE